MERQSAKQVSAILTERLRARRAEIENAIFSRVYELEDLPRETTDPAYVEGLRAAVGAAIEHGLSFVETGEDQIPAPPVILLSQARLAARNDVSLDLVMRRYFAGYAILEDFLVAEAEAAGALDTATVRRMLSTNALAFDRLLRAVCSEHSSEHKRHAVNAADRRTERLEALLAGELINSVALASDLDYDFDAFHTAAIVIGSGAAAATRAAVRNFGRRAVTIDRGENCVWLWVAATRAPRPSDAEHLASWAESDDMHLSIGEPGRGLTGWRHSHRQARAALPVVMRGSHRIVRYEDVALLTTAIQDDILTAYLTKRYLEPLERDSDGGEALRKTLRSYFAAECNVSSTAAVLGVNRNTVANRLREVEERIGKPVAPHSAEFTTALGLAELATTQRACLSSSLLGQAAK